MKSTRARPMKKAEATGCARRLPLCLLDVDIKNYVSAAITYNVSLHKNNMRKEEMRNLRASFEEFFFAPCNLYLCGVDPDRHSTNRALSYGRLLETSVHDHFPDQRARLVAART
ncbi:MAG: hypothetical protein HY962_07710 [Ignavibacteriae bacterium]|nr:hypothetical protein [Ignavibacteriota bacterium]